MLADPINAKPLITIGLERPHVSKRWLMTLTPPSEGGGATSETQVTNHENHNEKKGADDMAVNNGTNLELKQEAARLGFEVARIVYLEKPAFPLARVKQLVSEYASISIEDLIGPHKFQPLTSYRQAAMVASYLAADKSTPVVGRAFKRDHSTVIHAFKILMPLIDAPVRAGESFPWFRALMREEARVVA